MDYTALKTPGVYIDEIPKLPPSIASVETAIPAFIGYTEKTPDDLVIEPGAKIKRPLKIRSIFEYELYYGQTVKEDDITITIDMSKPSNPSQVTKKVNKPKYLMYYSLQMFFDNGGGECYIVSVGDLSKGTVMESDLQTGLDEIKKLRDVTLIVFPDATNMSETDYYAIHSAAISQCVLMKDRFTVFDVWIDDTNALTDNIAALRSANLPIGSENLKYAAVYYPRIYADI